MARDSRCSPSGDQSGVEEMNGGNIAISAAALNSAMRNSSAAYRAARYARVAFPWR